MPYGELFEGALHMAMELHRDQQRKGSDIPYVTHLLAVASLVAEAGGSETEVAAALLHDGPEDCGGEATLERIRGQLGEEVATIVEGCTDTMEDPKPEWRPRKEAYIRHLETAPASVVLVSVADKLHNARAIVSDLDERSAEGVFSRFSGGREGTLWYYRTLTEVYGRVDAPARLLRRLEVEVEAMERLAGASP